MKTGDIVLVVRNEHFTGALVVGERFRVLEVRPYHFKINHPRIQSWGKAWCSGFNNSRNDAQFRLITFKDYIKCLHY